MVSSSMAKKAAVEEKSMMVGGTGTIRAFAARRTDREIAPSAGGGSSTTTSNWSEIEAMPWASRSSSRPPPRAIRAEISYSDWNSRRLAGISFSPSKWVSFSA